MFFRHGSTKSWEKVWHYRIYSLPLHSLTKARALSSAGLEHLPYKQRVGGSNPSAPTRTETTFGFRLFLPGTQAHNIASHQRQAGISRRSKLSVHIIASADAYHALTCLCTLFPPVCTAPIGRAAPPHSISSPNMQPRTRHASISNNFERLPIKECLRAARARKGAGWRGRTVRFTLRNSPFERAKRRVSHGETGRVASRNWLFCNASPPLPAKQAVADRFWQAFASAQKKGGASNLSAPRHRFP